ncbi:MAG: SH3 domain-containing protein [Kofleriaceae bacterium]
MKSFLRYAPLLLLFVSACTADVDGGYFDEVPAEPALTSTELAVLPDGTEVEHNADIQALADQPVDDPATYDDDEVEPMVDVEVMDTVGIIDLDGGASTDAAKPTLYAALLRWGLHPRASDALRAAGVSSSRIVQTIGNAAASAGTHARDGYVNGQPYSAATDISVYGLSQTQIANLLERLGKVGFAAWYRHTGYDGWYGVNHIHAVYANCLMKSSLRSQVRSWLVGRNGLVSNTIYRFHTFSAAARATVKAKYSMSHEGTSNGGGGIAARVNISGTTLNLRTAPSLNASIVGSLTNGTYVAISCQKRGSAVSGTYGTSTLWDRVNGGYVSDAYVYTGHNGQIAPTCP